jgi:hypothetical protein
MTATRAATAAAAWDRASTSISVVPSFRRRDACERFEFDFFVVPVVGFSFPAVCFSRRGLVANAMHSTVRRGSGAEGHQIEIA